MGRREGCQRGIWIPIVHRRFFRFGVAATGLRFFYLVYFLFYFLGADVGTCIMRLALSERRHTNLLYFSFWLALVFGQDLTLVSTMLFLLSGVYILLSSCIFFFWSETIFYNKDWLPIYFLFFFRPRTQVVGFGFGLGTFLFHS
jgi:hypothetical protein